MHRCGFEVSESLKNAQDDSKRFDMVTAEQPEQGLEDVFGNVVPTSAVVIADGHRPLPADKFCPNPLRPATVLPDRYVVTTKARRQARFPVELLQKAFHIKVAASKASNECDLRHILNTIARRPLDDPWMNRSVVKNEADYLCSSPPAHPEYDRIDKLLHGHYALGGMMGCAAAGGEAFELCLAAQVEALRGALNRALSIHWMVRARTLARSQSCMSARGSDVRARRANRRADRQTTRTRVQRASRMSSGHIGWAVSSTIIFDDDGKGSACCAGGCALC